MVDDHFSDSAAGYAQYRPTYPQALFDLIADAAASHARVWDCATGTGQAARPLASRFEQVIATDLSAAQIAHADAPDNVRFVVCTAERTPLENATVDAVTIAQALHWLDLPAFYREVRRVSRPEGIIAAWSYGIPRLDDAHDSALDAWYADALGGHWPARRAHVEEGYRSLDFPFRRIETPDLTLEASWDLNQYLGYVSTWSGVRRATAATGTDPLPAFAEVLRSQWGDPAHQRPLRWPLTVLLGHVH